MIKLLTGILIALLLSACGSTHLTYHPDGTIEWDSKTLWKDVKDVDVTWDSSGEKIIKMGSSAGNGREEAIACLLAPQLCTK